jgi:hypothetical protein
MSEREVNQEVADEICDRFRLNGQEFRLGEWVALLDGKVVAVQADLGAALGALRELNSDPHRGMIFEVGPPAVDVIRCEHYGHRIFSKS